MIRTERLELRNATEAALLADLEGRAALAKVLGVEVPANWPPDLYDEPAVRWTLDLLRSGGSGVAGFSMYYFLLALRDAPAVAIGLGGFKGPPVDGGVEVGYSVLSQFRRQGYASEAVAGMLVFAFSHDTVNEVTAETLPELIPSIGVLIRNGFTFAGIGSEEGVIRYRITRTEWEERRPGGP